jgi:integrase
MEARITKRSVEALEPGPTGEAVLWDSELKGFGVRVRTGGVRTYVVMYRAGRGRAAPLRRITIGKHGSPWTAETARLEAKKQLGRIAEGADPARARREELGTLTIGKLAERFLSDHVEAKLKPRTVQEYRRLIDHDITPSLGAIRTDKITAVDVARFHSALRATPRKANHAIAVLSKMLGWAVDHGLRPELPNPCQRIAKNKERRHERFLSAEELARLGRVLRDAEQRGEVAQEASELLTDLRRQKHNARLRVDDAAVTALSARIDQLLASIKATGQAASPSAIAAIRLLIFTGARLSEIRTAEWSWVDLARGTLRLPDSKTGAKTIYLNAPARAVLERVERIDGNPYIIAGHKIGAYMINLEKPWQAIRKAAELEDVRLHDLRHSFASVGAAGGLSLPLVGALLGHSQPATTARYAHLSADPVKDAAEAIGAEIEAALSGGEPAKVVKMAGRRR